MSGRAEQAAAWMYRGLWGALVRWFRVPGEPPTLPIRPGDHVESFQPARGYLSYQKFWFWIILTVTDIGFAAGYIAIAIALIVEDLWWVALLLLAPTLFVIVAPDIVAYIAIHLRYDTTWYVMTNRSLRIRRGIWIITETTITFENVQNVRVRHGPVQRHFGIADVIVQTAGGGGGGHHGKGGEATAHLGLLTGVADAPALRDRIMARVRASRSAGLGDELHPEQIRAASPAWTAEHLAALREIREEFAALSK